MGGANGGMLVTVTKLLPLILLLSAGCVGDTIEVNASKPTGAWRAALSGTGEGVHWTVWRASGTDGGVCLSVETRPDLGGISIQRGADGSGKDGPKSARPKHRGRTANCVVVGDPAAVPDGAPGEVLAVADVDSRDQQGHGPHYVAAVIDQHATDVTALFNDGSTATLTPTKGIAFLLWRGNRRLTYIDLTHPTFEPPRLRCSGADDRPLLRELWGMSCHNA